MKNNMESKTKTIIAVGITINAPIEKVWKTWSTPADIVKWNNATDGWHTPRAENDLRVGGHFNYRMEAKDGSMGFDFGGVYKNVILHKQIDYVIGDGRNVKIIFSYSKNHTEINETFEAKSENPIEMQRGGWQAILDNFKKYAESI
jgi:uncharacterized protein YndB with AHSA1/START domain